MKSPQYSKYSLHKVEGRNVQRGQESCPRLQLMSEAARGQIKSV